MTAKLVALILPLGLDTLGVALALGVAGLPPQRTLRLSLVFAAFEAGMPLVGIAIGAPLGDAIGRDADYAAAALLALLGLRMLAGGEDEGGRVAELSRGGLLGMLALGVGISLDELAIGFSAGLLRLPVLALVLGVGLQAFIVSQLGVRLGRRAGPRLREASERAAGLALLLLAAALIAGLLL